MGIVKPVWVKARMTERLCEEQECDTEESHGPTENLHGQLEVCSR